MTAGWVRSSAAALLLLAATASCTRRPAPPTPGPAVAQPATATAPPVSRSERQPWRSLLDEARSSEVTSRGLFLDLPAWGYHAFEVVPTG